MSAPHVRRARPSDAGEVARVHVETWRAAYDGLVPASLLDALDLQERTASWRYYLREETAVSRSSVAVPGRTATEVLGFVSVGPSRDEDADQVTGEVWALYAHPDVWGGGIGSALHTAGLADLRRMGSTTATLWVLAGNVRARAFYERQGWAADGAEKIDHRDGADLEEVRYRRDL